MRPKNVGSKSVAGPVSEFIAASPGSASPEYLSSFSQKTRVNNSAVSSSLDQVTIDPKALMLIPIEKARQYKVLPVGHSGDRLQLAMVNPYDLKAIEDVVLITGMKVDPIAVEERELEEAFHYYSLLAVDTSLEQGIRTLQRDMEHTLTRISGDHEAADLSGEPVVKLVHSLLTRAVLTAASDIHIEPQDTMLRIRMRIDGELSEIATLPLQVAAAIGSRVKILSGLDISEKRLPQDGRLTTTIDNRQVSFRVSTLPSIYGEKLVLRVLDQSRSLFSIDRLGFYGSNRRSLDRIMHRPHGLVLVTGPTGSGKTSTLYAMLDHLNSPGCNIITLEDPVEYVLPGITQAQINSRVGFTFATGLRSVLRADPDIIMVGEIRDTETASLAVHAALTGHLVLASLHTTSAVGTVTRLLDMGIEPFLLASALSGVVSQRLVRALCPHCRDAYVLSGAALQNLGLTSEHGNFFYRSTGCHLCRGTGYRGRLAIQEVMEVDSQIRNLIIQGAAEPEIEATAINGGMVPLMEDGLGKAGKGLTTIEEVLKTLCLNT